MFVVGKIISTEAVPKSKMTKTLTDIGTEQLVILTNVSVEVGQKVVVATVGTIVGEGENAFEITQREMKGIVSSGMFMGNDAGLFKVDELEIGSEYSK